MINTSLVCLSGYISKVTYVFNHVFFMNTSCFKCGHKWRILAKLNKHFPVLVLLIHNTMWLQRFSFNYSIYTHKGYMAAASHTEYDLPPVNACVRVRIREGEKIRNKRSFSHSDDVWNFNTFLKATLQREKGPLSCVSLHVKTGFLRLVKPWLILTSRLIASHFFFILLPVSSHPVLVYSVVCLLFQMKTY